MDNSSGIDSVDRISDLPDSILGVILSSLRTRNAVATCILSKRWKFMWMIVHNLDFYHHERHSLFEDSTEFIRFVNRVLLLPDAGPLNKLRLTWNPVSISSSDSISWINTAITRNVRELELCVDDAPLASGMSDPFELPLSVLRCESLQSLELCGCISLSAATAVCLPRLKSLKLFSFYFQPEVALEKFISGCSMLNYLYVRMNSDMMLSYLGKDYEFAYLISSTSLKKIELYFNVGYHTPMAPNCSLKLEAPSLEYLILDGFIPKIFVQKSLSSLVLVRFEIRLLEYEFFQPSKCDSIVKAVRAFDRAKTLFLSADAMRAINCATMSLSAEYNRLMKLETENYYCDYSTLQDIIQSSNNLEALTVNQCEHSLDERRHSKWTAPAEVPRCLSNSLKMVVIKDYYGCDDTELEFIRYMLKHGSALQVMKIYSKSFKLNRKLKLNHKIFQLPRKSPTCQVQFFGYNSEHEEYFLFFS